MHTLSKCLISARCTELCISVSVFVSVSDRGLIACVFFFWEKTVDATSTVLCTKSIKVGGALNCKMIIKKVQNEQRLWPQTHCRWSRVDCVCG